MFSDLIKDITIDELLHSPAGEVLGKAVKTVSDIQRALLAISENDDGTEMTLLKIGTVFQIFLIDTLASGKRPEEFDNEDWKNIAEKVSQYAIFADGQSYTEFVFTMYADFIDLSAKTLLERKVPEEKTAEVRAIAEEIRTNTELLHSGELSEVNYVEKCLWSSLEAMIKCMSLSLTPLIGPEFTQLVQASSQLAFEYGRYVLYAREQALLQRYIENQYRLDEQLQKEFEVYLEEVKKNAERFQSLVQNAFSCDLHEALVQSAELARAAGVKEEELLTTIEDVDDYFS